MKGVQGIVVALALGLIAAVCNWFYLERLAGREEKQSFIGIRSDAQVNLGDVLKRDVLVKVDIPKSRVGNLNQVAPQWGVIDTVAGQATSRSYLGGELVLMQDLKTPGARDLNDKLGKDEIALWLPIDTRTFNATRVNPDDELSFLLPRVGGAGTLTPIPENGPQVAVNTDIVGPFRVLEIGNRTGRTEVQKAAGGRTGNENSVTIVARLENGRLDKKTEQVTEYLRSTKAQGLQVILHPKRRPGE